MDRRDDTDEGGPVLVEILKREAMDRGLLPTEGGKALTAEEAFRLVRDMPYRRASDRRPITTIREWRGTCSGKHYLLKELFHELGLVAKLMACTHFIADQMSIMLPTAARDVMAEGPVPDVHNYLLLTVSGRTMIVDATWPLEYARYGLPVNDSFEWGENMHVACAPIDCFEVPEGQDPQEYKEELLRRHFEPDHIARRDRFFHLVAG